MRGRGEDAPEKSLQLTTCILDLQVSNGRDTNSIGYKRSPDYHSQ